MPWSGGGPFSGVALDANELVILPNGAGVFGCKNLVNGVVDGPDHRMDGMLPLEQIDWDGGEVCPRIDEVQMFRILVVLSS